MVAEKAATTEESVQEPYADAGVDPEIVLDIETADFEQTFEEIEGGWRDLSPLQYLNEKQVLPEFYGMAALPAGGAFYTGTLFAATGPDGMVPMLVWYGGLCGMISSMLVGQRIGKKINNLDVEIEENFPGTYQRLGNEVDVEHLIQESDAVAYVDRGEVTWATATPGPETVATDYADVIDLLETEHEYWLDEFFLNDYERLTEEDKALIDSYTEEERQNSDLVKGLPLEEMQEHGEAILAETRSMIEDTEINQYLRTKRVDEPAYTGTAYQLEVYQGEDRAFVLSGVAPEDLSDLGVPVRSIDPVQQ